MIRKVVVECEGVPVVVDVSEGMVGRSVCWMASVSFPGMTGRHALAASASDELLDVAVHDCMQNLYDTLGDTYEAWVQEYARAYLRDVLLTSFPVAGPIGV